MIAWIMNDMIEDNSLYAHLVDTPRCPAKAGSQEVAPNVSLDTPLVAFEGLPVVPGRLASSPAG